MSRCLALIQTALIILVRDKEVVWKVATKVLRNVVVGVLHHISQDLKDELIMEEQREGMKTNLWARDTNDQSIARCRGRSLLLGTFGIGGAAGRPAEEDSAELVNSPACFLTCSSVMATLMVMSYMHKHMRGEQCE